MLRLTAAGVAEHFRMPVSVLALCPLSGLFQHPGRVACASLSAGDDNSAPSVNAPLYVSAGSGVSLTRILRLDSKSDPTVSRDSLNAAFFCLPL